ncbi:unnamed protein product [Euphydryas editha]|uniref:DDE-1 domain-containing protein n=1 Tax=Euphydryas editha TaxID=104508 RepID=A0AAU9TJN5_EUPED|nr:unnamed protein product [Euphydryas editha]
MPSQAFISKEEWQASGFEAAKDRLTLLLGENATGCFKLKPLLVYQSETPRAMRGTNKDNLSVVWRSNPKAWVTRGFFPTGIQTSGQLLSRCQSIGVNAGFGSRGDICFCYQIPPQFYSLWTREL